MSSNLDKAAFSLASATAITLDAIAIDPRDHGARADGWQFADGTVAAGALSHITFANPGWAASAVTVGNPIVIAGAGVGGTTLITTIAGFIAPATIVLNSPAAQAMTNATGDFGSDDTAALQSAIAAASATGAPIECGGAGTVYYIAGPSAHYPTGFNRGSLRLMSNLTIHGNGAAFVLSGGRVNPGGIFYNDFWTAPGTPLRNVRLAGVMLDGNIAMQSWSALPAGFSDSQVWQWGHALCLVNAINVEVAGCHVRNVRGDGVNVSSFAETGGAYHASRGVLITRCEFDNVFGNGVFCEAIGVWITQNHFHGDGYWVAAIDIETNAPGGVGTLQAICIENNVFDFRDGLSVVERTPAFATNSPAAQAARVHLRRAISLGGWSPGMPGGTWNGNLMAVTVRGNTVWQGVMDASDFRDLTISGNRFVNTYEAITGSPRLIHSDTIFVVCGQGSSVTGLERVVIDGNTVESALAGRGITVSYQAHARVVNNAIKFCQGAGIRFEASSGHIAGNEIRDVGASGTGDASDLAGIAIYGGQGQPLEIMANHVIDMRATPVLTSAVYANVSASPLTNVVGNTAQGVAATLSDINGTCVAVGNHGSSGATWATNLPVALAGALNVAGAATIGDTSGGHDAVMFLSKGVGGTARLLVNDAGGLTYQIAQSASGGLAMQNFAAGAYQWTDLAFSPSGQMLLNLTWQKPMLAGGNTFLWVCQTAPNAGQCRKKIGAAPTGDVDGVAGWS